MRNRVRSYLYGLMYLTMAGCPKSCGCGIDCSQRGGYHYNENGDVDGCNDTFVTHTRDLETLTTASMDSQDTGDTHHTLIPLTGVTGETGGYVDTTDTGPIQDPDELCVDVDVVDSWNLYYRNEDTADENHWFRYPLASGTGRLCGHMDNVLPGQQFKLNSDLTPYVPPVQHYLVEFDGTQIVNHITEVEVGGVDYLIGETFDGVNDCAIAAHAGDPGGDLMCTRR